MGRAKTDTEAYQMYRRGVSSTITIFNFIALSGHCSTQAPQAMQAFSLWRMTTQNEMKYNIYLEWFGFTKNSIF
jgi:hypothetical protein